MDNLENILPLEQFNHSLAPLRYSVSHETFETLKDYVILLQNAPFNLISAHDRPKIWHRHILDCAQLFSYIDKEKSVVDLGSGAGLPGVVLAILGAQKIVLVESNQKKASFLKNVSRETKVFFEVMAERIENIKGRSPFDFVVSRALAPLKELLSLSVPLSHKGTVWVLNKGRSFQKEIDEARKKFYFDCSLFPSITNEESRILVIKNIKKRG